MKRNIRHYKIEDDPYFKAKARAIEEGSYLTTLIEVVTKSYGEGLDIEIKKGKIKIYSTADNKNIK